ncbi:MAG TPA: hypothetical protein VEY71_03045, partial [Chitinophagales bacterium]|nr:hypothetical protein [Chitinophagales bacterium]
MGVSLRELKLAVAFLAVVLLLATGCHSTSTNNSAARSKKDSLEGNWILTEYYDSIMANKSIATNSLHRIAWEAFALKIENDCLFTYGLLFTTQKSK